MNAKDIKQLEAIYEAQLILDRINSESVILNEKNEFLDTISKGLNIAEWFGKALPYIKNAGLTLVGVNLISKILEYLGKKANTISEEDAKKMYSIAPPEIKQKFDELAQLKDKDPEAYQAGIKQIRDYAMQDLKGKLKAKGVKVEDGLLGKTLTKLGSFGDSFIGTIVITGAIFTIMHFLGIYSPPSFINKSLGDRAGDIVDASTAAYEKLKGRTRDYIDASKAGFEKLADAPARSRPSKILLNPIDTLTGAVGTIGDIAATGESTAMSRRAGKEMLKKMLVKYKDNPEKLAQVKRMYAQH